jgi:hypothetical protein
MLSVSNASNSSTNIKLNGFSIDIYPNKNYITGKMEYALQISPSENFCADLIPDKTYHFVFDVDTSGSMGGRIWCPRSNIGALPTRIEIVQNALVESMAFLSALAKEGKMIYVSIVTFNTQSTVVLNHYKIPDTDELLAPILQMIKEITLGGATNMGCSIDDIQSLVQQHPGDEVCTMLISDGYVNQGMPSSEIKQLYLNYFNSAIGIGQETDYDKSLLLALTSEGTERSCDDIQEMKDQIIDSVFGNLNKVLQELNLGHRSSIKDSTGTVVGESSTNVVAKDMRITGRVFAVLNSGKSTIQFNGVPGLYMKSAGMDDVAQLSTMYSSVSHRTVGEVEVTYSSVSDVVECNQDNRVHIAVTFDLKPTEVSTKMSKQFRAIQQFTKLSNDIVQLDLDNIQQHQSQITTMYKQTLALKSLLDKVDPNDMNDYMSTVLTKFTNSLKPFAAIPSAPYTGLYPGATGMLPPPTLLRMCSSQASRGSYAFSGRQVSLEYSRSFGGVGTSTGSLSVESTIQQSAPPVTNGSGPPDIPKFPPLQHIAMLPIPSLVPSNNNALFIDPSLPLSYPPQNTPLPPPSLIIPSSVSDQSS